jgi:hypothetical protein
MRAKPAFVNGDLRSLTKTKGDAGHSGMPSKKALDVDSIYSYGDVPPASWAPRFQ